jgi:NadR type nicotinamide-nucleotide adenylyltransferase
MNRQFEHGLVVGKFYPPHVGHLRLVTEAADRCTRVTVVVAAASWETLALDRRVDWLAWEAATMPNVTVIGARDDHPVDYEDPQVWDAHTEVFLAALSEAAPGQPVDAVFTGEEYGDELARRLGAMHVRVIRPGTRPSGTAVRSDPIACWDDLLPAARSGLAFRIVIVGAESTGTTTLARALADHYDAAFVPEYGRTYSAAKLARLRQDRSESESWRLSMNDLVWTSAEFTRIAARQTAAIDEAAKGNPVVIADTDGLATSVWHDRYVGGAHQPALDLATESPPDLYVLTTPDGVPFVDDGLRDGEDIRDDMTVAFERVLEASGCRWISAEGPPEVRLEEVVRTTDAMLDVPRFQEDAAGVKRDELR